MQIILLHPRFQTKSLTLATRHLAMIALAFIVCVLGGAALLSYVAMNHAIGGNFSFLREARTASALGDPAQQEKYIKENLAAMAIKLGEMQAQLMRLDALGERVQGLAGIKPEEFNFKELPGRGGAALSSYDSRGPHTLSMDDFQKLLGATEKNIEHRADYMNVVETSLMQDKIKFKLLPTIQPVNVSYNASGFGWRIDPFSGKGAFHEGIDFPAATGTPIVAAAGGVVIAAEYHHQFGNMLEIDHGNDIVTRYAHASRLLMKVGDIVKRGQQIAHVGSSGRSTGAHLHFEVLVKDIQQNPQKFLAAGAAQAKAAHFASK